MPDIDVDFCFERRQEVIEYVRRKYVDFDFEFVKSNQGKFVQIVDKIKLEQISVLFAREIVSGYLIFDNIKSALVCSGMHGYILSAEELNRKLLDDISSQVRIEKVY